MLVRGIGTICAQKSNQESHNYSQRFWTISSFQTLFYMSKFADIPIPIVHTIFILSKLLTTWPMEQQI